MNNLINVTEFNVHKIQPLFILIVIKINTELDDHIRQGHYQFVISIAWDDRHFMRHREEKHKTWVRSENKHTNKYYCLHHAPAPYENTLRRFTEVFFLSPKNICSKLNNRRESKYRLALYRIYFLFFKYHILSSIYYFARHSLLSFRAFISNIEKIQKQFKAIKYLNFILMTSISNWKFTHAEKSEPLGALKTFGVDRHHTRLASKLPIESMQKHLQWNTWKV